DLQRDERNVRAEAVELRWIRTVRVDALRVGHVVGLGPAAGRVAQRQRVLRRQHVGVVVGRLEATPRLDRNRDDRPGRVGVPEGDVDLWSRGRGLRRTGQADA